MMNIEHVIIWGHPLYSNTYGYIHNAFFRAFQYLGYKTQWFDDKPLIDDTQIPRKDCLFISECNSDRHIPLFPNCKYVLHLHSANQEKKYRERIPRENILLLQVFTYLGESNSTPLRDKWYERFDGTRLYQPWATDLLPYEIQKHIDGLEEISSVRDQRLCIFIGMHVPDPWNKCKRVCENNDIEFRSQGGFRTNQVSLEDNMRLVQESYIAPAFQEPWQVKNGYIPCRIFKNISYGKMGITNNPVVQKLLGKENILFDADVAEATREALECSTNPHQKEVMEYISDEHTYLNRIAAIFECFDRMRPKENM